MSEDTFQLPQTIGELPNAGPLSGTEYIEGEQGGVSVRILLSALFSQGDSAYELAVANGFVGNVSAWLASLHGKSAYDIAQQLGYTGTASQWIVSLKGIQGERGLTGNNGSDGARGADGRSAYDVAVAGGFTGGQADWLLSLKGLKGDTGERGLQGIPGNPGTNGTNGTNGAAGADGLSAYQIAVNGGFSGTMSEWLLSLKGADGGAGFSTGAAVFVDINGNDSTAVLGSPSKPFKTINAALDALPSTGGDVFLSVGRHAPVAGDYDLANSKMRSNLRFYGSGMPELDSYTAPTRLVSTSGTVIDGPLTFHSTRHNCQVMNLGVDSGSNVCATRYGGTAQEALIFGNVGQVSQLAQARNLVVENVVALCQSATALVHGMLFENVADPYVNNVRSYFGVHGVVIKSIGGRFSNILSKGHYQDVLIVKESNFNNDTAPCHDVVVTNVTGGALAAGDTPYGISLQTSHTRPLERIVINGVSLTGISTAELQTISPSTGVVKNIRIDNFVTDNGTIRTQLANAEPSTIIVNGKALAGGAEAGTLTVKEVDGAPSIAATTIVFPNGTLSDGGDGQAIYTPPASSGGGDGTPSEGALYVPGEPWKLIGEPGNAQWNPGYSAFSADYHPAYRKIKGRVYLKGLYKGGSGLAFTLPAGYRPAEISRHPAGTSGLPGGVSIGVDGTLAMEYGNSSIFVALDSVSFECADYEAESRDYIAQASVGDLVLIGRTVIQGGEPTIDFLGFDPSTFASYELVLDDLRPSGAESSLRMRLVADGTPYVGATQSFRNFRFTSSSSGIEGAPADTSLSVSSVVEKMGLNFGVTGKVELSNLGSSVLTKRATWLVDAVNAAGLPLTVVGSGSVEGVATPFNGVRLFFDASTFGRGSAALYGRLKASVGSAAVPSDDGSQPITWRDVTANRTVRVSDFYEAGKRISPGLAVNLSTAVVITVPSDASQAIAVGSSIAVYHEGTGNLTFAWESGVLLTKRGGQYQSAGQEAMLVLTKRGPNKWVLSGDIAP
jgi:hypothetical protein